MKIINTYNLQNLKFAQRDKLADFSVNIAVAWFAGSIITTFLFPPQNLLTWSFVFRILAGMFFGAGFLLSSLKIVGKGK